ncbi:enolase C-terminal domain-like protein [Kitasatospora sp. NPDC058965]|uniref:enolase C-terminal domain-like protein n=1 Tax=Kitasatospora sp. NPDC058965 TaxID=3346682 RepID=UPI0036CCB06F
MSAPTPRITAVDAHDLRFPNSWAPDDSDAPHPGHRAAYLVLRTADGGPEGHGLAPAADHDDPLGALAALGPLRERLLGSSVDELCADPGALHRDDRFRGPWRAALVHAVWDLAAKRARKPLWQLLAEADPHWLVGQVDFRYLTDALSPDEALHLLRTARAGAAERAAHLRRDGYPGYAVLHGSAPEQQAARAAAAGFTRVKLRVGADLAEDLRRCRAVRRAAPTVQLVIDAAHRWEIGEAIEWTWALAEFDPYWVERPTRADDLLGHAAVRREVYPVKVAAGAEPANRVVVKQLLQAEAVDILQLDCSRVSGVNEGLAILLLSAAAGVPVCPHPGALGRGALARHLAMFDYVALSGSLQDRAIEVVDRGEPRFADPLVTAAGRCPAPTAPGLSAELHPVTVEAYRFPDGSHWRTEPARGAAPAAGVLA